MIASVDGYSHPTSSAPMGGTEDPGAVVDAAGAVRGVDSLHVIDASLMPDIVSAPKRDDNHDCRSLEPKAVICLPVVSATSSRCDAGFRRRRARGVERLNVLHVA